MKWVGIDYGSKLAGTTVAAYSQGDALLLAQSDKKQDADLFLSTLLSELRPDLVFIDVPLSVPGVYRDPARYTDYFYRACDKQLNAMSPMFLGGLTARGMQLKSQLAPSGIQLLESYPSALAKLLKLADWEAVWQHMQDTMTAIHVQKPVNKHQADALLCYLTGWRYQHQQSQVLGSSDEGQIHV